MSKDILNYYGFNPSVLPNIQPVFSNHGELLPEIAAKLNLKPGIPAFINKSKKDYMVTKKLIDGCCAVQNEGIACFSEENVEQAIEELDQKQEELIGEVIGLLQSPAKRILSALLNHAESKAE